MSATVSGCSVIHCTMIQPNTAALSTTAIHSAARRPRRMPQAAISAMIIGSSAIQPAAGNTSPAVMYSDGQSTAEPNAHVVPSTTTTGSMLRNP